MPVPDFDVLPMLGVLGLPALGELVLLLGAPVVPVRDVDLRVAPEPVPAGGVDGDVVEPGCVADGAGGVLGVLPPDPVAGALPVPVLPPVLCASAGPIIAATSARVARMLMTRDAMTCSSRSEPLRS
jgi:hypothetical protein